MISISNLWYIIKMLNNIRKFNSFVKSVSEPGEFWEVFIFGGACRDLVTWLESDDDTVYAPGDIDLLAITDRKEIYVRTKHYEGREDADLYKIYPSNNLYCVDFITTKEKYDLSIEPFINSSIDDSIRAFAIKKDFTLNTLILTLDNFELLTKSKKNSIDNWKTLFIDPLNGISDMLRKEIVCCGKNDPNIFILNPNIFIRVVRLLSKYDDWTLDKDSFEAIQTMVHISNKNEKLLRKLVDEIKIFKDSSKKLIKTFRPYKKMIINCSFVDILEMHNDPTKCPTELIDATLNIYSLLIEILPVQTKKHEGFLPQHFILHRITDIFPIKHCLGFGNNIEFLNYNTCNPVKIGDELFKVFDSFDKCQMSRFISWIQKLNLQDLFCLVDADTASFLESFVTSDVRGNIMNFVKFSHTNSRERMIAMLLSSQYVSKSIKDQLRQI